MHNGYITTLIQAIFFWEAVYVVWHTSWEDCAILLSDSVAVPDSILECIQFSLHQGYHKKSKKHPI